MKSKLILALVGLAALLLEPSGRAQNYSASITQKSIPIDQLPQEKPSDETSTTSDVISTVKDSVGSIIDTVKDNHWEQNTEFKVGHVYLLRRSTDEPIKPGEIVILRFRTPTEIKRNPFSAARAPHIQMTNLSAPTVVQKVVLSEPEPATAAVSSAPPSSAGSAAAEQVLKAEW